MSDSQHRSHAAHERDKGGGAADEIPADRLPSYLLHPDSDEVRGLLEELDDAIFGAIQGSDEALDQAKSLWPRAIAEIDWQLVDESREQYLRFAVETSKTCALSDQHSPENAIAVLEIISLLTKD